MKRRVLTKTMSFHPLFTKKRSTTRCHFKWYCASSSSPGCAAEEEEFMFLFFPAFSLSLSLFPQLDQTLTRHTPSTHPAITLKKGEGSHALQKTPHATLPYAMTRQDKVASSPSAYKYGEAEKRGGKKKEKKEKKERQGEKVREKEERNINTKTGD